MKPPVVKAFGPLLYQHWDCYYMVAFTWVVFLSVCVSKYGLRLQIERRRTA